MKEKWTEKKGLPIAKCKTEKFPFIFFINSHELSLFSLNFSLIATKFNKACWS